METPVTFTRDDHALRGILHVPDESGGDVAGAGVLFLHGWSGCRLGPHRMFVKMARQLGEAGYTSLRFDFAGRGESDGVAADASIDSMILDAQVARDVLVARTGCRRVTVVGICSGSKVAVGQAAQGEEADDLVLLSHEPMGAFRRGGETTTRKSASVLRAYLAKLTRPETWRKILKGRVNTAMVRKAVLQEEAPDAAELVVEDVWLDRFRTYAGRLLFVYGSHDPTTAAARDRYVAFCEAAGLRAGFHTVADANHSFYSLAWEREVIDRVASWLSK